MRQKGFTLLEVIGAIFILTVGVGSAIILISQTLSAVSLVKDRLIASYLVQEGIEIVRNIRDTNWLQARDPNKTSPWDDGLICPVLPCYFQADYTTLTFAETADFEKCSDPGYNCHSYDGGQFLYLDGNTNFYRYIDSPSPNDVQTKFKRKITISEKTSDKMRVDVEVSWQEKGRTHNFKALEYLTNWYEK